MIGGFANYRFRFVLEVGPLTPVKGHGASCLQMKQYNKKVLKNIFFKSHTSETSEMKGQVQLTLRISSPHTCLYKRGLGSLIQNYLLSLHKVSSMTFRVNACDDRRNNR